MVSNCGASETIFSNWQKKEEQRNAAVTQILAPITFAFSFKCNKFAKRLN